MEKNIVPALAAMSSYPSSGYAGFKSCTCESSGRDGELQTLPVPLTGLLSSFFNDQDLMNPTNGRVPECRLGRYVYLRGRFFNSSWIGISYFEGGCIWPRIPNQRICDATILLIHSVQSAGKYEGTAGHRIGTGGL
jgi:hypothetical protein